MDKLDDVPAMFFPMPWQPITLGLKFMPAQLSARRLAAESFPLRLSRSRSAEVPQFRALHGRDVDQDIVPAALLLDKAEASRASGSGASSHSHNIVAEARLSRRLMPLNGGTGSTLACSSYVCSEAI